MSYPSVDINTLFSFFSKWSDMVKSKEPLTETYINITSSCAGYATLIYNGERIVPFSWESPTEGVSRFIDEIKLMEKTV